MKNQQIELFLKHVRLSGADQERVFTEGGCLHLYFMLRTLDKSAQLWYDGNHFITVLNGVGWDITGRVDVSKYLPIREFKKPSDYAKWLKAIYYQWV